MKGHDWWVVLPIAVVMGFFFWLMYDISRLSDRIAQERAVNAGLYDRCLRAGYTSLRFGRDDGSRYCYRRGPNGSDQIVPLSQVAP